MPLSNSKLNSDISLTNLSNVSFFKKRQNVILLKKRAETCGLSSKCIMKLVNLIGSDDLNSFEKKAIISCIIPSKSIPKRFLLEMACHLTNFKLDCDIKIDILKRIIVMRPFIDSTSMENFLCVYEIFLKLLHFETLRPYVVYFIYSFTKKELVTRDRIIYFDKMLKMRGTQPWLVFILSLYSKLQPKLVTEVLPDFNPDLNNSLAFYPFLLETCHSLDSPIAEEEIYYTRREKLDSFHFEIKNDKKSKLMDDTRRNLYMSNDNESDISENVLCTFSSFEEVYKNICSLRKLPPEKILNSQFRRLILTLDMTKQIQMRVFDYIFTSLYYSSDFGFSISLILDVLREIHKPLIPLSEFIKIIIMNWDGFTNMQGVLEILSYQEICSFDKIIYPMEILQGRMKTASIDEKCYFLYALNKMYQNWTLLECVHYKQLPYENNYTSEDMLEFDKFHHLGINEIYKLGSYIDVICDEFLSYCQFNTCIINQVLLHYEKMSQTHMTNKFLILHLPISSVFISAMFSLSSSTLENLCRLIFALNTEVYSDAKQNHPETNLAKKLFSSCLYDFVNFLWLEKAYKLSNNTYLPRTVFEILIEVCPDFKKFFLIEKHPALMVERISFYKQYHLTSSLSALRNVQKVNKKFITDISKDKYFEYFSKMLKFCIQKYPVTVKD